MAMLDLPILPDALASTFVIPKGWIIEHIPNVDDLYAWAQVTYGNDYHVLEAGAFHTLEGNLDHDDPDNLHKRHVFTTRPAELFTTVTSTGNATYWLTPDDPKNHKVDWYDEYHALAEAINRLDREELATVCEREENPLTENFCHLCSNTSLGVCPFVLAQRFADDD